jgi:hypothetical protein
VGCWAFSSGWLGGFEGGCDIARNGDAER